MFIYMKFKSRQHSSLAREIRTVLALERKGDKMERDTRKLSGVTEIF